jgi:hypothetical protein
MTLEEYRTKPVWPEYEQLLIGRGWAPSWVPEVEALVVTTSIVCPRCGQLPAYVGMHKAGRVLAFLVCREACSQWAGFRSPSSMSGPEGGQE